MTENWNEKRLELFIQGPVLSFRVLLFSTLLIIWATRQGKWSCCKCLHFFDVTNHNQNGFTFSEADPGKLSFSPKHKCFCCLSIFIFFADYHWTKVSTLSLTLQIVFEMKRRKRWVQKVFRTKRPKPDMRNAKQYSHRTTDHSVFGRYIRTFSRTWHEYTQNLKLFLRNSISS